jgi:hypothetical protein
VRRDHALILTVFASAIVVLAIYALFRPHPPIRPPVYVPTHGPLIVIQEPTTTVTPTVVVTMTPVPTERLPMLVIEQTAVPTVTPVPPLILIDTPTPTPEITRVPVQKGALDEHPA